MPNRVSGRLNSGASAVVDTIGCSVIIGARRRLRLPDLQQAPCQTDISLISQVNFLIARRGGSALVADDPTNWRMSPHRERYRTPGLLPDCSIAPPSSRGGGCQ